MHKRRLTAALFATALVLPAVAGAHRRTAPSAVPGPGNSTCPTSVVLGPEGGCCFDVVVRDLANNPIALSSVVIDFGDSPMTFCPTQPPTVIVDPSRNSVRTTTDIMGVARFCVCGGVVGEVLASASIFADGVRLGVVPVESCGTSTLLNRTQAMALADSFITANYADTAAVVGFLRDRVADDSLLAVGTAISDLDSSFTHVVQEPEYFFWIDGGPHYEWLHPSRFLFIKAGARQITTYPSISWPRINGVSTDDFIAAGDVSPDRFHGTYGSSGEPPFQAGAPPAGGAPNKYLVIVIGKRHNTDTEPDRRASDLERAKSMFVNSPLGPRVPSANVIIVGDDDYKGATEAQIDGALNQVPLKSILYFVYLGHGSPDKGGECSRPGGLLLRDPTNSSHDPIYDYPRLGNQIANRLPVQVHVLLATCYSGTAVRHLSAASVHLHGADMGSYRWRLKGEVVTSAAANRKSDGDSDKGAPFMVALEVAFQTPAADLDKNGEVALPEAVAWARSIEPSAASDGAGAAFLDDDRRITFPAPSKPMRAETRDCTDLDFLDRTTSYQVGPAGDGCDVPVTTVSRRSLFAVRTNKMETARLNPLKLRVRVECADPGSSHAPVELPVNIVPRQDSVFVSDLPLDCRTFKVTCIRGSSQQPLQVLDLIDAGDFHLEHRTRDYFPGEPIYWAVSVATEPGHFYHVGLDSIPGWRMTAHASTLAGSALADTQAVIVSGVVPIDAVSGGDFKLVVADSGGTDTSGVSVLALLRGPKLETIGGGVTLTRQSVPCSLGVRVESGTARLEFSRIDLPDSAECLVAEGGTLEVVNSVVRPDSAGMYNFTVEGRVFGDEAWWLAPRSGLRLAGATGRLNGGGVLQSGGDGLVLGGDLLGLKLESVLVDSSAGHGIVFEAGSVAELRGVRVSASGGMDLVVRSGASATFVDGDFDPQKLAVEAGATLMRGWSTAATCQTASGSPIPGVRLEIRDVLGELVGVDTLGASGEARAWDLFEFLNVGGTQSTRTPHSFRFLSNEFDTSIVVDVNGPTVVELVHGPNTGGGTGPPPREFGISGLEPNPTRGASWLGLALPRRVEVEVEVLDLAGRHVQALHAGALGPGRVRLRWDTTSLAPGLYVVGMRADGRRWTRKALVIR